MNGDKVEEQTGGRSLRSGKIVVAIFPRKSMNKPVGKRRGRGQEVEDSRGDRMQAVPAGRGGCSGIDRVFRDVKVKELGGLKGADEWSTGTDAEVTHLLLTSK